MFSFFPIGLNCHFSSGFVRFLVFFQFRWELKQLRVNLLVCLCLLREQGFFLLVFILFQNTRYLLFRTTACFSGCNISQQACASSPAPAERCCCQGKTAVFLNFFFFQGHISIPEGDPENCYKLESVLSYQKQNEGIFIASSEDLCLTRALLSPYTFANSAFIPSWATTIPEKKKNLL